MRPGSLSDLLIVLFSVPFKQLLQYGDYVRAEVRLASECVNYARDVDLTRSKQSCELVVRHVRLQTGHQKVYIRLIHQLSDDLHFLVAFLDRFVDIDGFGIKHLIVQV
jgi:hypothetical protein